MPGDPQRIVLLPQWQRVACTVLNILPIPGAGAIWAGIRNPHTRHLRHGIAQAALVVFGTYPWIFPGVIGFGWAIWTAVRIYQDSRPAMAWTQPV